MDYTTAEYAQVLAARLWFRVKSLKSIAEDWEIGVDEVCAIQSSEEYRLAVETLIRTTRSPGNLLKWIESSGDYIPSELAKRMGIIRYGRLGNDKEGKTRYSHQMQYRSLRRL